mgnify:CR=1 FL=1
MHRIKQFILSKYLLQRLYLYLILVVLSLVVAGFATRSFSFGIAAIVYALILFLFYEIALHYLYKPYRDMKKIHEMTADGFTLQDIYSMNYYFDKELEGAIQRFKAIIDTKEIIDANRRQAQYLALQNQINPHFLYNTLESIRGEALIAGIDEVAEMTKSLALFYRYTISNLDQEVTLENELENIENYFSIQKFRFAEKLSLHIEIDPEEREKIKTYSLPKLVLQPIVENAIFHGLEPKVGKGNLDLSITVTQTRIILLVTDNGLGIPPERLEGIRRRLNVQSIDYIDQDTKQGGIALVNVNNRIRLLYGEEYGVSITSTQNVGTTVEVTLPKRFIGDYHD